MTTPVQLRDGGRREEQVCQPSQCATPHLQERKCLQVFPRRCQFFRLFVGPLLLRYLACLLPRDELRAFHDFAVPTMPELDKLPGKLNIVQVVQVHLADLAV